MAKNYRNGEYALTVAELIEKFQDLESKDGRHDKRIPDKWQMDGTIKFFVQSSNNWFPSAISLDKSFRKQ